MNTLTGTQRGQNKHVETLLIVKPCSLLFKHVDFPKAARRTTSLKADCYSCPKISFPSTLRNPK